MTKLTKIYLFLLSLYLICQIIYYRFIFVRIPFDVKNVSDQRAISYLILAIIFTIILFVMYYNFIRTHIIKKPINENSIFFKMKKYFNEKIEKYGPNAALKFLFLFIYNRLFPNLRILNISPRDFLIWMMGIIRTNRFSTKYKYYYDFLYWIFVALPRIFVATLFVIDVCYYQHIEYFYKWSLLLAIPLIFNTTLGILKIFYDEFMPKLNDLVIIRPGDETDYAASYKNPEFENIMPLSKFMENFYLKVFYFNHAYRIFEGIKSQYFLITLYTMHCYLIGWSYILYFYGPNFIDLFLELLSKSL